MGFSTSLLPALARGNLVQAEKERLEKAMGLLLAWRS